jgi:hypothetical protein
VFFNQALAGSLITNPGFYRLPEMGHALEAILLAPVASS